jgi:hypothetical protein
MDREKFDEQADALENWITTHEAIASEAEKKARPMIGGTLEAMVKHNPLYAMDPMFAIAFKTIFLLGFYIGRTYQDVPDIFLKGFDDVDRSK